MRKSDGSELPFGAGPERRRRLTEGCRAALYLLLGGVIATIIGAFLMSTAEPDQVIRWWDGDAPPGTILIPGLLAIFIGAYSAIRLRNYELATKLPFITIGVALGLVFLWDITELLFR